MTRVWPAPHRLLSGPVPLLAVLMMASLFPPSGVQAQEAGAVAFDSAGVRIVWNPDPASVRTIPEWRVSSVPGVRIGMLDGPEPYLLSGIRHGLVLESGEVVVANATPVEVRIFDRSGRHLRSFGTRGEGPGEFRGTIGGILPLGGSTLGLSDGSLHLHLYDASDGSFRRSIQGPYAHGFVMGGNWVGEGLLLEQARGPEVDPETFGAGLAGRVEGAYMPSSLLVLWDAETLSIDTLGVVGGIEQYRSPSRGVSGSIPNSPVPLGRRGHTASGTGRIYAGTSGRYEIRGYDFRGDLVHVVRRDHTPRPVSEGDRALARERQLSGSLFQLDAIPPEVMRAMERQALSIPVPDTHPVFAELLVARTGHLWVRMETTAEETSWKWEVFNPAGELEAVVEMPPVHRVLEIGADYILVVTRDALEVEYVELLQIER